MSVVFGFDEGIAVGCCPAPERSPPRSAPANAIADLPISGE